MRATPPSRPKKDRAPTTGAALVAQARARNRWMAIGIAGFVISVFVIVMAGTVLNKRYEAAKIHARHHTTVAHTTR